jgi:hypothetical protein
MLFVLIRQTLRLEHFWLVWRLGIMRRTCATVIPAKDPHQHITVMGPKAAAQLLDNQRAAFSNIGRVWLPAFAGMTDELTMTEKPPTLVSAAREPDRASAKTVPGRLW